MPAHKKVSTKTSEIKEVRLFSETKITRTHNASEQRHAKLPSRVFACHHTECIHIAKGRTKPIIGRGCRIIHGSIEKGEAHLHPSECCWERRTCSRTGPVSLEAHAFQGGECFKAHRVKHLKYLHQQLNSNKDVKKF